MTATTPTSDSHRDALENQFGLADRIVDEAAIANSVARFRERGISLPTFAQLADPSTFSHAERVGDADPQGADARNLWRVHWYNDLAGAGRRARPHRAAHRADRGRESDHRRVRRPFPDDHRPQGARGVRLPAPRVVTGQFDPARHRAIWPSTGNYARGGIAISRIMASRGVAILPEG
ncbi:MAG: hypothetical protein R2697_06460 [Ilumatobacteraceae bacterium]